MGHPPTLGLQSGRESQTAGLWREARGAVDGTTVATRLNYLRSARRLVKDNEPDGDSGRGFVNLVNDEVPFNRRGPATTVDPTQVIPVMLGILDNGIFSPFESPSPEVVTGKIPGYVGQVFRGPKWTCARQ